jgi:hypothetical protein
MRHIVTLTLVIDCDDNTEEIRRQLWDGYVVANVRDENITYQPKAVVVVTVSDLEAPETVDVY